MSTRLLLMVFLWLSCYSSFAQRVSVAVRVDKENILIGEQFQLIIAATMPSSSNAGTFRIDSIPHFEIVQAKIDTQQSGKDRIYQHTLTLTSWDSGRWNIPPFTLPSSNRTKPIPITVSFSNPFDPEQEYHDVKDIMEVPKPERETWFWYLIGLLLLILLFLLLFPPNRKKDKGVFAPDATIYKRSMDRLEQLSKETEKEPKIFYTELINVFRDYLQKRKGIQSHSKTTEDISRQLTKLDLQTSIQDPLTHTLQMSDMVKFARLRPEGHENKQAIEDIKKAIITIEAMK